MTVTSVFVSSALLVCQVLYCEIIFQNKDVPVIGEAGLFCGIFFPVLFSSGGKRLGIRKIPSGKIT